MPTIAEVRQQYPQYSDMSDADLANALHAKFYSDMPKAEFDAKIGLAAPAQPAQRSVMDQLLGIGGPRHVLPPEQLVRNVASGLWSGAKLPGEYTQEAMQPPPAQISDSDVSALGIGRALDLASLGAAPSIRTGVPVGNAAEVRAAATRGYNSPAVTDLRLNPTGPANLADTLIAAAEKKGLRPDQPGANEIYNRANELRGLPNATSVPKGTTVFQPEISGPGYQMGQDVFKPAPATIQDITGVRTSLGSTIKSGTDSLTGELNPVAGRAAQVRSGISDYLNNLPAADVVQGDPQAAAEALARAGADYAASKKLSIIDALERRRNLKTGSAASGKNFNNVTRQEVKNFLLNQQRSKGLTDQEVAAAETAAMGTVPGNLLRSFGNRWDPSGALTPTNMVSSGGIGAGLGHMLGVDPTTSGIAFALGMGGAGKIARTLANRSEERAFKNFKDIVLSGSPTAREELARAAKQASQARIARALLLGAVPGHLGQ